MNMSHRKERQGRCLWPRRATRATPDKGNVIVMKNKAAHALRTIAKNAIHQLRFQLSDD
jgi:hypothetical protein